jgi:hypothetical protein
MAACIVNGCPSVAENNIGVRVRRPDTTAIWAPNTDAYLCDLHAAQGLRITVVLTPTHTGNIETIVSSPGGLPVSRTTPIVNEP